MAIETEDRDNEQREMAAYTNAPTTKPRKFLVNCRYYTKGECDRGNQCKFIHQTGPVDIAEQSDLSEDLKEQTEPFPKRTVIKRKAATNQHLANPKEQIPHKRTSPSSSRSPTSDRHSKKEEPPRRARTSKDEAPTNSQAAIEDPDLQQKADGTQGQDPPNQKDIKGW